MTLRNFGTVSISLTRSRAACTTVNPFFSPRILPLYRSLRFVSQKQGGDLTDDSSWSVDSEPTWANEPKSTMPTFSRCDLLVTLLAVYQNYDGVCQWVNERAWKAKRGKAMANHLLETAKKIVMMYRFNSKSTIVTEGETLRPESDLPATEEEHNEESGATGS